MNQFCDVTNQFCREIIKYLYRIKKACALAAASLVACGGDACVTTLLARRKGQRFYGQSVEPSTHVAVGRDGYLVTDSNSPKF
jgi:hypothetical protein